MHSCFRDRVAVVTGAAGGMGRATARQLAAAGARVALLDVKPPPADLGATEYFQQGDLTDADFVSRSVERIVAEHGPVRYLVHAAGVLWFGRDRDMETIDLADWDRVMDINLKSMVHAVRAVAPSMKSAGGAMVHVSSIQCLRGDDRPQDAYQASKAAIIAASRSLAVQYAGHGIRSNVLLPGPTFSPMQERWDRDPDLKAATARAIPLGRVAEPADMANAIVFLLSDYARHITGTELVVDGGRGALP